MVVVVQKVERPGVAPDDVEDLAGLKTLGDARHDLGDLAQLLEPPLVLHMAGHDVATQHVRCPASELNAARGLHAVAGGEDHVEVVVLSLVRLAVAGSCRKFCDNSILGPRKLLPQCVGDVLADGLDVTPKEGCELRATQPNVLPRRVEHHRQLDRPVPNQHSSVMR